MVRADDPRAADVAAARTSARTWDAFVVATGEARRLAERNPEAALELVEREMATLRSLTT